MPLSLLIFDCDGVLLESMDIKTRAFRRIGSDFNSEIGDRLAMYHAMHGGVSRFSKFAWLYREAFGREIRPEESAALNSRFVEYALEEIAASPMVPGTQAVLDYWLGRIPMYVASGAPEEELIFLLEKRGLSRYFTGIYGAPPAKDKVLKRILKETGLDPRETVMVGDSFYDLRAAEAAGTLFYGRGSAFKKSGYPWYDDLTLLTGYLESL